MGGISADSLPGAGMNNDSGFLSIPSPPPSRGSSALGSYANSTDGEVAVTDKGRPDEGKEKDQKGNVIVSVRVRPSNEQETPEWTVDGRNAVVAYRGNGGGDYKYGEYRRVGFRTQANTRQIMFLTLPTTMPASTTLAPNVSSAA